MTSGEHNVLHEEDNYDDLIALMKDDQSAIDPGPAFFESLHADIMDEVEHGSRQLTGAFEESPTLAATGGLSAWIDTIRNFFGARPTVIMGLGMAAALCAIVLWPKQDNGTSIIVDAGQGIAQTDVKPKSKGYDPADGLDPEARAEALELAEAIDLDMDLDSEEDDWEALSEFDDDDDDLQTL